MTARVSSVEERAVSGSIGPIWTVVVNWRQADATLACLASLERAGVDLGHVIVIDNGSGDDSTERVREAHANVTVLAQTQNLGFARAVNIGAEYALERGAGAVFILNNDAEVLPGVLDELARSLARSPRVGLVTAKVYLTERPGHLWAVGGTFTGRRVVEMGAGERDVGTYDDARIDFAYGCALLVRARTYRDLRGFDERFFLYYEDIDLCLRARDAGWEVAFAPNAHVLHEGSKSTEDEPESKVYHHARSRLLFFARHARGKQRALFAMSEVAFIAREMVHHVAAGRWKNAVAYARGTVDALRSPSRRTER
ncbi:MAG TPA: glycosyltransferase family 2 protein [Gemmatimonadaceae bacterium]|nr:glycosyltransferase family 2 protein [Gemmatimonadaceae bacterium]